MGYRTRTRSLTSDDAKRASKKPKLETLDETKTLMIDKLKNQIKQKTKSKSDGDLFDNLQPTMESVVPKIEEKCTVRDDDIVNKIKDEIQAWVIPEV